MNSVLFICSANICRSPMAMGLLRSMVEDASDQRKIESAGVWDMGGQQVAANTQLVLKERGIDLNDHISRTVTGTMLSEFNLVPVMEDIHKEVLKLAFPEYKDRICLLSEMVGEIYDIVDPIGGSLADFEETALEMERILTEGFEKISNLAVDNPIIYAS
jgi:protein-tyrosine-phosphatase